MSVIWKDILNYEGCYQVSNTGLVRSLDRMILRRGAMILYPGKELKPDTFGEYYQITFSVYGKLQRFKIHRLVAMAFIENPHNLPQINHKDGDKFNNNDWNLEWCTPSQNIRHSYKTGLANGKSGNENPASKLTEDIVYEIISLGSKVSADEWAERLNVHRASIQSIFRGDTWSHITGIKKRERDENRLIIENKKAGFYKKEFETYAYEFCKNYSWTSNRALAKELGVNRQSVANWINNKPDFKIAINKGIQDHLDDALSSVYNND